MSAAPSIQPAARLEWPWQGLALTHRDCPLCHSSDSLPAGLRADEMTFAQCMGCGLVYANPAPDIGTAASLYRQDYFGVAGDGAGTYQGYSDYLVSQDSMHDPRRLEVALLRRSEPDLSGRRVLEVGCGSGTLLSVLKEQGCGAAGVELNPAAAEQARRRLDCEVYETPFELGLPRPTGTVDLFLACSVLEHSAAPGRFLDEAARLVATNGLLLVITPRWEASETAGEDWIGWRGQWDHLCYFSLATLDSALRQRGFKRLRAGAGGPPARLGAVRRARPAKRARAALRRTPFLGAATVKLKRRLFPPRLQPLESESADLVALYRKVF